MEKRGRNRVEKRRARNHDKFHCSAGMADGPSEFRPPRSSMFPYKAHELEAVPIPKLQSVRQLPSKRPNHHLSVAKGSLIPPPGIGTPIERLLPTFPVFVAKIATSRSIAAHVENPRAWARKFLSSQAVKDDIIRMEMTADGGLLAYFSTQMRAVEAINMWRATRLPQGVSLPARWARDEDLNGGLCSLVPKEVQLYYDQKVGTKGCEERDPCRVAGEAGVPPAQTGTSPTISGHMSCP